MKPVSWGTINIYHVEISAGFCQPQPITSPVNDQCVFIHRLTPWWEGMILTAN